MLWGKLQSGMSRREVRAALPSRAIRISDNCIGILRLYYLRGSLIRVHIDSSRRNLAGYACGDVVEKSLKRTYGDGATNNLEFSEGWVSDLRTSPLWGYMHDVNQSKYDILSWLTEDKIVFFRAKLGSPKWSIDYVANPKPAPEGRL
jgi:hypothetical protein